MPQFSFALVKFNGGRGALLCNGCNVIIASGFDYEDKKHFCKKCQEKQDGAGEVSRSKASV